MSDGKKPYKRWGTYKKYGKWYSYKKLNYLMKNYFNAKLSMEVPIIAANGQYEFVVQGVRQAQFEGGDAIRACSGWARYRPCFNGIKYKGVAISVIPGQQIPALSIGGAVERPYEGNIIIGLLSSQFPQQGLAYGDIAELNHTLVVSKTQVVRKYFPFLKQNWVTLPAAGNAALSFPMNFVVGNNPINQAAPPADMYQQYTIRIDFYVMYRQSII